MSTRGIARSQAAAQRARAMVIRKGRLGQPEADFSPVSGAAAISLLTRLTRESFSLAGIETPDMRERPMLARFVPRKR